MTVQIGTIFSCSWGYDQTNVDFYEVVKVTPASVVIRPIEGTQTTTDGGWTGKVMPNPGAFKGDPITKRLKDGYDGVPTLRMNSYSWARLWDGSPKSFTAYA